jgi:hypothetical protein
MENHGDGLVWIDWWCGWKPLENKVFPGKQKPRLLRKRAGFERNPMNDSVLELPARGHGIKALAKSIDVARDRLGIASV